MKASKSRITALLFIVTLAIASYTVASNYGGSMQEDLTYRHPDTSTNHPTLHPSNPDGSYVQRYRFEVDFQGTHFRLSTLLGN